MTDNFNRRRLAVSLSLAILLVCQQSARAQSGPRATPEEVAGAAAAEPRLPDGPVKPTWDSVSNNYAVPDWWRDAKFGIMMHWGLYAVPAHTSEWYELHMYNNSGVIQWHQEHFGAQDKFGYKDFIPMFTAAKWDPDAWAELFRKAGAKFVVPTAEHHDGFSLWDSAYNKYNAKLMGPKRDLIGDLAKAVRAKGLKFGVSNHSMEHYTFVQINQSLKTNDLYDPAWADFYSVANRYKPGDLQKFLAAWVAKNLELIDKYQPDLIWFDNGVNDRVFDPLKLKVAAYYFNSAKEWGKQVTFSTKDSAYRAGSVMDYERMSRAPAQLTDYPWQVDDPVLYRFGYTADPEHPDIARPDGVVRNLINNVSKNGGLLLNISPKADGTIPDNQQQLLLDIGKWLDINGDAIYGTRPWTKFGEGTAAPRPGQAAPAANEAPRASQMYRFTTKGDTLYAIALGWPGAQAAIASLAAGAPGAGKITGVQLLGHNGALDFTQDADGLKVKMPADKPCDYAYALKLAGLKLH
jgi:alpha-L-fucosidase